MCNAWCKKFVADSLQDWPDAPEVLEVGSRNVNGSPRELCQPRASRYMGCDLEAGDGVDRVADATKLTSAFAPASFDIVISTEMMEHVSDWPAAWSELMAVLRPGGLLILTTRSPGFPPHDYPGDFWRFTADDIREILDGIGDVLRIEDDCTLDYSCGVGVVVRKRVGVDLHAWRRRLASRVLLHNVHACAALTYEAFAAGIPTSGELEPLRSRIKDLEQKAFDAQIMSLGSHNAAKRLAMCEDALAHACTRIKALEDEQNAWYCTGLGRVAKVAHAIRDGNALLVRIGRYLLNPTLRARILNHLERRWQLRLCRRRIRELPDLDWLLDKLALDVPAEQVTARLGSYLTRREETNYLNMIEALRKIGEGKPSSVSRPSALPAAQGASAARKRILFVCGEFPDPVHGGGCRVSDFIKALSAEHEVYVAAWYARQGDRQVFVDLEPYCRSLLGLSFEDLESGCVSKLMKLIDNRPVDIVHYEWPRSLNSFDRRLGRHHIYTHMEVVSCSLWMDLCRLHPLSPAWLRRLTQLLTMIKVETLDAARMDAQVVVTAKDGEFLARFVAGTSFFVINHGVNRAEFDVRDRAAEPNTLVFTGNFNHYPNVDAVHFFMRDIRPLILAAVPDLHVWLVGANPPDALKRYDDKHSVFVTGRVPDVRPYIQKASVCIAPLISGAGLRTKVVQYAALRRPCVITSIAAEDLMFEDGREVCIADRPEAFAARVIELLGNPVQAAAIAESARKRALRDYDNLTIAERNIGGLYDWLDAAAGGL